MVIQPNTLEKKLAQKEEAYRAEKSRAAAEAETQYMARVEADIDREIICRYDINKIMRLPEVYYEITEKTGLARCTVSGTADNSRLDKIVRKYEEAGWDVRIEPPTSDKQGCMRSAYLCFKKKEAKQPIGKPPLEVTKEMREKWGRDAERWAEEAKKRIVGRDLPPGFDPDDEHVYRFRIPK